MKCPKCGQEQIPSDTCNQCGIVFSKYDEIQKRKEAPHFQTSKTNDVPNEAIINKLGLVIETIRQRNSLSWQPISTSAMVAISGGFAIMVYLLATKNLMGSDSTVLYLVHNVNLVFHEAGHWIFGIFGNEMLGIFGGSLNQALIPAIVAASFWLKRDAMGFAFGLFWFFENLLDIAVYMADARALVLPLIGGLGEDAHDWRNLFFRFGLIDQDTTIAAYTQVIGWVGMGTVWAWFLLRYLTSRKPSKNNEE